MDTASNHGRSLGNGDPRTTEDITEDCGQPGCKKAQLASYPYGNLSRWDALLAHKGMRIIRRQHGPHGRFTETGITAEKCGYFYPHDRIEYGLVEEIV